MSIKSYQSLVITTCLVIRWDEYLQCMFYLWSPVCLRILLPDKQVALLSDIYT